MTANKIIFVKLKLKLYTKVRNKFVRDYNNIMLKKQYYYSLNEYRMGMK